ncbi:unnamed protein product [Paramecium sonneborni]|uniref:Uncharacterized protein n=1 Tax=Paramecium sonneborni TaxID=65129 RepID=A0A8S1NBB2_9CILI|nr:unnamed protein product [Paramecium sonneborni]
MQQTTGKFMEFINSQDKLRINELKHIEQEQYYINQLKEQRERMEVLKVEFLKKDLAIGELQIQNQNLTEDITQLRVAFQEQMKYQEKEIQRSKKQIQERDDLLRDLQELGDLVLHLRKDNENLNSLHLEKQSEQEEQKMKWEIDSKQLKGEIQKLDNLLFAMEPIKMENKKLKEEMKNYKSERKKIQSEMRLSRIEINKQLEELKQVIQDQQQKIVKLQQFKESHYKRRYQQSELENKVLLMNQENEDLKQELKRFYEKEESEIKIKSQIDRVREDLISVRNQEVEKLNELFKGIVSQQFMKTQSFCIQ